MITAITALEAPEILAQGAFVLDVREDDEFAGGRMADATHIRLSELPDHLETLPHDRAILCVCRSGGRSGRAATFLDENGFTAINLDGGMQAWAEAGFAMVADSGDPVVL